MIGYFLRATKSLISREAEVLLWKNLHSEALVSRISGQLLVGGVCCLSHPDWEGLTFLLRLSDLPFAFRHQC